MNILALETSAKACSAAVAAEGVLTASCYQNTGLTHSRTLMPMVESMLRNAGVTMEEIDAVAVAAGPGSFTGIRIGVAAAKGLALAAGIPAIPVSTLEAMAENGTDWAGLVVCAMDARRGQIYNAVFEARDGALLRRTPDRAISLADLARELRASPLPKLALGDGGTLCRDFLTEAGVVCVLAPPHLLHQNAASVALAAERIAASGGTVTAQALLPVYLRPVQADRLRQAAANPE